MPIKRTYGNPFVNTPVYSFVTGKLKRITPRNLQPTQLQTIMTCYEYLASIPYIAAMTGLKPLSVQLSTRNLKRPPNEYIRIVDIQKSEYAPTGLIGLRQIFTTTERGEYALINRGFKLPLRFPRSNSPKHDVFAHNGVMSLEIGLKAHPDMKLYKGADIYDHLPTKTKELADWWNFPVYCWEKEAYVKPDYFPLGIDRNPEEDPLFLVFEFERGTHNLQKRRYKLKDWEDVLKNKTYKKHMNLPNLYIAIITLDITDKDKLKTLIKQEVDKEYWPYFLLKAEPEDAANGWMLQTPFERVTDTFHLLTGKLS